MTPHNEQTERGPERQSDERGLAATLVLREVDEIAPREYERLRGRRHHKYLVVEKRAEAST